MQMSEFERKLYLKYANRKFDAIIMPQIISINGQNTRSDFTYMILHVCIIKDHTTFAPHDFTYDF